jgi:hypothetical protein
MINKEAAPIGLNHFVVHCRVAVLDNGPDVGAAVLSFTNPQEMGPPAPLTTEPSGYTSMTDFDPREARTLSSYAAVSHPIAAFICEAVIP